MFLCCPISYMMFITEYMEENNLEYISHDDSVIELEPDVLSIVITNVMNNVDNISDSLDIRISNYPFMKFGYTIEAVNFILLDNEGNEHRFDFGFKCELFGFNYADALGTLINHGKEIAKRNNLNPEFNYSSTMITINEKKKSQQIIFSYDD